MLRCKPIEFMKKIDVQIHVNHNMIHWMTCAIDYHGDSWLADTSIECARDASKVEHLKGYNLYCLRGNKKGQNASQNETQMTANPKS